MKNIILSFFLVFGLSAWASDEHGHDEHKHDDHAEDQHEHAEEKDEHGHAHGEEEGSHEDENSAVGPGKGIVEKGEKGFKLSEKAVKNFDLKTMALASKITEIERKALVEIKENKFVYRIQDGWIKKIPVRVVSKSKGKIVVELSEFSAGDQIITNGNGFVRTSEIISEEGVSHGHSH